MRLPSLIAAIALVLSACATTTVPTTPTPADVWTEVAVTTRPVGLGLPGGADLADGVRFAGGLVLRAPDGSPFHSISDLKHVGDWFYAVSDVGDLFRWRVSAGGDARGPAGLRQVGVRRLTRLDGTRIEDKVEGDAEGLAVGPDGAILVSFERQHRIWSYGPEQALRGDRARTPAPTPVRSPDYAFPLNDGMEALSARPGGWRVAGESGGVWDCTPDACAPVVAPPDPLLADSDFRITSMDRDPAGDGFFVVQRAYRPPIDARARVRRMAADGSLGPVLVELKLPGTTDNFEGLSAIAHGDGVRLYILSDDNDSRKQRTLLLAFDVEGGSRQ